MTENLYGWVFPPEELSSNYVKKCRAFVENNLMFDSFRQDRDYTKILEGGGEKHGELYLKEIKKLGKLKELKEKEDKFKENDVYGKPSFYDYPEIKDINHNTLMYIAHSFYIQKFLGNFIPKKIVEIGGGYGGMCKTLEVVYPFEEYILVDLPEAIDLSKKYLSNFPTLYDRITFIKCDNLENVPEISDIDLSIAVFSLSECSEDVQLSYTDKFVLNSKYAFIGYNKLHVPGVREIYNKWTNKISKEFEINKYTDIVDVIYIYLKKLQGEKP